MSEKVPSRSGRAKGTPPENNVSDLGFLLSQVGDQSQRRFASLIEPLGLRPIHVGVLRAIASAESPTQRELGERLGMFASNLVKLVSELEKLELLERVRHPEDGRSYLIQLTRVGETKLKAILEIVRKHQKAMCSVLTSWEQAQLHELLMKVAVDQELKPGVHPELNDGGLQT